MMKNNDRKLVTTKELFNKAILNKYGIGGFNINNLELIQAVVEASEEMRSPLILQISQGAKKYITNNYLIKLVEGALLSSTIPVVLHLDHGESFEVCKECIDLGFTSVMIDGSKYDFEKNIEITKQVVGYAHNVGVVVEAELGRLAGVEDEIRVENENANYTDPSKVEEFVTRTGCDSLAVSIGTSHGAYKFRDLPKLDFERLTKINKVLGENFPIVLHGASSVYPDLVETNNSFGAEIVDADGVNEEMLKESIALGVVKINTDTDLRLAFSGAVRRSLNENKGNFDPRVYLGEAKKLVKEVVKKKINIFGSSNKA